MKIILLSLFKSQLVVWVDPLDGTKEYTEGDRRRFNLMLHV